MNATRAMGFAPLNCCCVCVIAIMFTIAFAFTVVYCPRYPILIAVLMPVVTAYIFLPVMVSTTIDPDRVNYAPGHFSVLASKLCSECEWLSWLFVVGAICSFIGLYNAQVRGIHSLLPLFVHHLCCPSIQFAATFFCRAQDHSSLILFVFFLFLS